MRRAAAALLALSLASPSLAPSSARADWPPQGLQVAGGPGYQQLATACPDGAGGLLVTWLAADDTLAFVLAQRWTPTGVTAAGWPAGGRLIGPASVSYAGAAACSDSAGGEFVSWNVPGVSIHSRVRLQHIRSDGMFDPRWPTGGRSLIADNVYQGAGTLTADGGGGAFVAWVDEQDGWDRVRVQHVLVDGSNAPGWPAAGVTARASYFSQEAPLLASDGANGVWIGWLDGPVDGHTRYVHHVLSDGRLDPALPVGGIPFGGDDIYADFGLVADGAGGVYAGWDGSNARYDYGSFIQHFTIDGGIAPGWPDLGLLYGPIGGTLHSASGATDDRGGMLEAWGVYDVALGQSRMRVSRILSDATIALGWPTSATDLGSSASGAGAVVGDGIGGAIAAWLARPPSDTVAIVARYVASDGTPGDRLLVLKNGPGYTYDVRAATDGAGGAFVAWNDLRANVGGVYVARVTSNDLTVPTLLERFDAVAIDGGVRITWSASATDLVLERATEAEGPWSHLGGVISIAGDVYAIDDLTGEPGRAYWYRLGQSTPDGGFRVIGTVRAAAVDALRLVLDAPHPTPARTGIIAGFTLHAACNVRLGVYDVTGREVAALVDARLDAGRHEVRWDGRHSGERVAGLYFLRLVTPTAHAIRRVVIE